MSGPSAMKGRHAGRPTAAATTRKGSSRTPGKSNSACRCSAEQPQGRGVTSSPRRLPARNSRRRTGTGSGRTTGRARQTRDQEGDESRRDLPGRQLGPHAGDGEAEVHSGARMRQEEVPGHIQTGEDGQAEGKSGGPEEDG